MKLLSLEIGEQFRSLHPGFQVNFHKLTDKGVESMLEFQPFCFAGLNGSGKSNVLEALAAIFYHLEFCVAKFRPESFEKHFKRNTCTPDAFKLQYLICLSNQKEYNPQVAYLVTIDKKIGDEPHMFVEPSPTSYLIAQEFREVSLKPSTRSLEKAAGKEFLPDLVVGYSSGENEILSLPFIKNRLVHFDEYKEAVKKGFPFDEPETSLLYIDEEMSQAVLLACMLYEDPATTLKPLKDELGIVGIQSFRMNLNMQGLAMDIEKTEHVPILQHVNKTINFLKNCATSWFERKPERKGINDHLFSVLTLDFFVDDKTKQVFKEYFKSSFELFRFFQMLYELNANIISTSTKEEVYKSKGFYTDGKLPEAGPEDRVFYFLDYMILKAEGGDKPNERLLREFSDGEHQFLHTMGICLMLKDRRTLLLLDEPETHFNPGWSSKFINVLKKSIEAGGANNFFKDIVLTTHSPFIISDCKRDFVRWFIRGEEPKDIGFQTYGTSIDYIMKNTTNKRYLNSEKSITDLKNIIKEGSLEDLEAAIKEFGKSSEKQFLYQQIERLTKDS